MKVMHHIYAEKVNRIAAEITRFTKGGGILYIEAPAYERAHRPESYTEPEPGTYVHTSGDEKGVPHHFFREDELTSLFSGFAPLDLSVKYDYHYCFTALRK